MALKLSTRKATLLHARNVPSWVFPLSSSQLDHLTQFGSNISRRGAGSDPSWETSNRRKDAMRYYVQIFSPLMTTNDQNNCLLSVFLPMAMDASILQDAILAWSASHLSLRDSSRVHAAMELRTASLSSFSAALSHRIKKSDLESSLASCLVLCGIEVILGHTSNWYKHLIGAYEIIRSSSPAELGQEGLSLVPTCFQSSSDGRWLLRSFAYHDILMSICCQSRPLLPGYYFASQDDPLPDSCFGLASKIMYLISEVSMLNVDMNEISEPCTQDSFADMATTFSGRAHDLETQLLQWQCPTSGDLALITLAEVYRAAGLIYLYRSLRRHIPSLSKMKLLPLQATLAHFYHSLSWTLQCSSTVMK